MGELKAENRRLKKRLARLASKRSTRSEDSRNSGFPPRPKAFKSLPESQNEEKAAEAEPGGERDEM